METMQTQKVGEDHDASLPNNPFVPPKGDTCFINDLPPELLSRIFETGDVDDDSEGEDDMADCSDTLHHYLLDGKDADGKDASDSLDAAIIKGSEDGDDEKKDNGGSDDEADSDATAGFPDFLSPWPPFQMVVSHVCRHWRNVALSTPSLWTTIATDPDDGPPYEHVSTMLERSKGLPIDIYIDCEPHDPESHDETDDNVPSESDLEFLYSLLVPHIHRWRTIEISVSEYRHMYIFLTAVSDPSITAAPQLKTLELYHHEETDESDGFTDPSMSKHFVIFGGSAPCLTKVVLWGVHVDWNQPWISSASKLVDLELAYHPEDVRPSWVQFSAILRGASILEKLSLRGSGPPGDPAEWLLEPTPESPTDLNAPFRLLKVTDFTLAFQSQPCAIGLLHKLYLPTLKNLVLDFEDGDYTDFVGELVRPTTSLSISSIQAQPCSLLSGLESLKIAGLSCRTECVEKLYGKLQNLRRLDISLSYLDPLFLDILSSPRILAGRVDTWLPRLATLQVSGTSGDILREVVERRKEAGTPLDSLYVEESCDLDNEDMEWLKKNLKTFEFFEGSDDEDVMDFDDFEEEIDEWSDMED